jgi:hypothetical protein
MGAFTYILRDLEQIFFPNRDQHPIPAMDGPFTPNDRLDSLHPVGDPLPGADDVAEGPDGALYVSAGRDVVRLDGEGYAYRSVFATFAADAGALSFHPDGRLLVCVAGSGLAAIDAGGRLDWLRDVGGAPLRCLTGVAAAPDGTIFACEGSSQHEPGDWLRDLMAKNCDGRLVRCGPGLTDAEVLLRNLAYPHGLMLGPDGGLLMTESWTHRVSRAAIERNGIGPMRPVIANMPGYPARLAPAPGGGFWLALFAARTHLVEFVLREDDFREEMMRTIDPSLWVGPALAASGDCYEPMQWGGLKALGIEKPWAPPRAYGLLARFDSDGEPLESLHSRVGGRHHGITSARAAAQGLVVIAKGAGRVLLGRSRARA